MKNALMATTAAAALVFTAGAASAQVDTTSGNLAFGIGGFFTAGIGYVDTDREDDDEVGFARNAEIHFDGRLTADNGLTFGVDIEFELGDSGVNSTDTDTDIVDEASMFVSGSFGKVEIGEQDGAGDAYMNSGVVAPPFTSAQDGGGFLFDYYGGDMFDGGAPDSSGGTTSDSLKISYYTPNFSGFSAGVSYVPEPGDENGTSVALEGQTNAFEFGAGYEGEFSGVSIGFGGGYVTDTSASSDDDASFGLGGQIGYAGVTVGVNYGWEEDASDDSETIGAGITYGTGPWVFGADMAIVLDGENEDDFGAAGGVSYALAPGVSAGAVIEFATDDSSDNDGFAIGAFLSTAF